MHQTTFHLGKIHYDTHVDSYACHTQVHSWTDVDIEGENADINADKLADWRLYCLHISQIDWAEGTPDVETATALPRFHYVKL